MSSLEIKILNYRNFQREIQECEKQIEEIEKDLQRAKLEKDKMEKDAAQIRLEILSSSAGRFSEGEQQCTCDSGKRASSIEEEIIPCRRHLSRYYQNKGCFICNYTDCSSFGC